MDFALTVVIGFLHSNVSVFKRSAMKIECTTEFGKYGPTYANVKVDGKLFCSGRDECECPEDMILGRDLNFILSLPELFEKIYLAGKNGLPFDLVINEEQPRDE